jgi:hypothetical protein
MEKFWIEMGALALALILGGLSVVGILGQKEVGEKGLAAGMLNLLAVSIIGPLILILGLEKILNSEAIAAIVGGLVGFTGARLGNKAKPPSS